MVAPNLTLADTSLDLCLGAAITQDEDVTIRDNVSQVKAEPDWDTALTGGGRFGTAHNRCSMNGLSDLIISLIPSNCFGSNMIWSDSRKADIWKKNPSA